MDIKTSKEFWVKIEKEKTIAEVENKFNATVERNNKDLNLYSGEWVKVCVNDYKVHVVKPTENLVRIAEIYNVSPQELMKQNNLENEKIFIGQRLKIKNVDNNL